MDRFDVFEIIQGLICLYSNMLKKSNKQIMSIKYLISLSSLPTKSTLYINRVLQTSSATFLSLNHRLNFLHQSCFSPASIPLFLKYSSSSASSIQTKNLQSSSSSPYTKENQNQSTIKMDNIKQHLTIVKKNLWQRAIIESPSLGFLKY